MSRRTDYEEYLRKRTALQTDPRGDLWTNQESRYVKPFQIFGNVWYVGDSWVCAHLVDTGDGLLLIDAGNCGATAMLIQAIWEAGFKPNDIKWCILSHGHLDHIGGALFLRRMFGTKLYLGEPEAKMFLERPELSVIQDSPSAADGLFEPDSVIRDGDILTFGGTEITCRLVPGHSDGCVALFFDVSDGTRIKRAGYYGGFGFNTLAKDYLIEIGDPTYQMRQTYLKSLESVWDEKVDIFLGNHTINNGLLEKRKQMLADPSVNPFIDSLAWKTYLGDRRNALLAFMSDPKNN